MNEDGIIEVKEFKLKNDKYIYEQMNKEKESQQDKIYGVYIFKININSKDVFFNVKITSFRKSNNLIFNIINEQKNIEFLYTYAEIIQRKIKKHFQNTREEELLKKTWDIKNNSTENFEKIKYDEKKQEIHSFLNENVENLYKINSEKEIFKYSLIFQKEGKREISLMKKEKINDEEAKIIFNNPSVRLKMIFSN